MDQQRSRPKKFTLSTSDKMATAARRRSKGVPHITIEGVGPGHYHLFQLAEMRKLGVDERYQRIRVTHMVNELIQVIKAGGQILDPATIAERADGSWWIVDGQQRWWACSETNTRLPAMIHKVRDFEAERKLFLILNRTAPVNACTMVKAWAGPVGDLIRKAADVGGRLEGRVSMTRSGSHMVDASILAKCAVTVASGTVHQGDIQRILQRTDTEMAQNVAAGQRVEKYLHLLGELFGHLPVSGTQRLRGLPLQGLALVAYKRWAGRHATLPEENVLGKLRRLNWDEMLPGLNTASTRGSLLLPLYEAHIAKRWPE